jgi:hypothetical protein
MCVDSLSMSMRQVTDILDSISQSNRSSTDYKLSALSALSSSLSATTCASAPNCSSLFRQPCELTSNTCGSCVTGYIGVVGDSNIACIRLEDDGKVSVCRTRSDCHPWETCVSGTCQENTKICSNGCSEHGTCRFFNTSTFSLVKLCLATDSSCMAVCVW